MSALLTTTHHTEPHYRPHVELYPDVDLQPGGQLRSIYTGEIYAPERLIVEDAHTEQRRLQARELLSRADRDEERAAVFEALARLLHSLAAHRPEAMREAALDAFSWASFLPEADRDQFLSELTRTLLGASRARQLRARLAAPRGVAGHRRGTRRPETHTTTWWAGLS